ncbi:MAG TPA: type II secretion system F family protein [Alphaproteobacteria bacterium]|nr:type II secretion system F family protein [Alphaproteobacteria bacterium]
MDLPVMMAMCLGFLTLLGLLVFDQGGQGKALGRRLKRVKTAGEVTLAPEKTEKLSLKRDIKDSGIPLLDKWIKSALPNPQRLREWLARTGLPITVSEYLLITALAIVIFFLLLNVLAGVKMVTALFVAVALGIFIPQGFFSGLAKKRAKKFIQFFPESIDAMVRSLRSGLPVNEAINVVAAEMPDPVGAEFGAIRDGVRMGLSLEEAMWSVAKRLDVPEYRYLIIALSIQRETGGNLGETLANVGDVLRKRRQIKLKIRAMSSEARASAMILGALPFVVLAVLAVVSSGYISVLFSDPRGHVLCGIALGMMGLGLWIMSQLINFEI